MEITTQNLNNFREDFKKAVENLQKQYNVIISLGSISYSDSKFTSKITVMNCNENGEFDKEAEFKENHKRIHSLYDIPETLLDKEFKVNENIYRYVGLDLSKKKNIVVLEKSGTYFGTSLTSLKDIIKINS